MVYSILLILKLLLFTYLTKVDNYLFYVVIVSMLFVLNIFLVIKKLKNKEIIWFITYSIISCLLFIDILYFFYFNTLPSIVMISQAGQVTDVLGSLLDIINYQSILFILDLPIIYFVERKYKLNEIICNKLNLSNKLLYKITGTAFVIILVNMLVAGNLNIYKSISSQELFSYHINDLIFSLVKKDSKNISNIDKEMLMKEIKERSRLDGKKYKGIARGKNLIVIQVESLQEFVIDLKYNNQEVTPNLNKLIGDNSTIYFDRFYQMIGKGNTADAEFSINNSLYPSMTGASYVDYEKNYFNGLPWLVREDNYNAWAFHGYKKDFWNRNNAYKNQGFQKFISEEDFNVKDEDIIGFGLNDEKFFKESLEYIKKLDQDYDNPFYAFLVTLTSHNPYKMPKKYETLEIEERFQDTILGNYFQAIHYTDRQVGMFIEELKKEGIYEDTVIAIYGDHFGIGATHKEYKDVMEDFLGEEYSLEEMQRIPLLIHIPNEEINERISKVSSQLDFLPTIANLMDLNLDNSIVFGRDIINYKGDNYVAMQTFMIKGSFISENEVFTMSRDGIFSNGEVYDINTKEKLDTEKFKHIYEKVTSEINLCDYILNNNLYKEALLENYNWDLKKEINLNTNVYLDDGSLGYLKDNLKGAYVVDVSYDKDTSEFIFGNNTDMFTFTDLIQSNNSSNTVLRFKELDFEEVRKLFSGILGYTRNNDKKALTGLYPIVRNFDEYHYLKTLGHEPLADIVDMKLKSEQLDDFINNQDLKIAIINDKKSNKNLFNYLKSKDIYIYKEIRKGDKTKVDKDYYGFIEK